MYPEPVGMGWGEATLRTNEQCAAQQRYSVVFPLPGDRQGRVLYPATREAKEAGKKEKITNSPPLRSPIAACRQICASAFGDRLEYPVSRHQ